MVFQKALAILLLKLYLMHGSRRLSEAQPRKRFSI
jgi:hypothetical protein